MAYFAGCIGEWCAANSVEYKLVTPREWKGQTSKEVIERRITARLGVEETSKIVAHALDAVGLGLWLKGVLHVG